VLSEQGAGSFFSASSREDDALGSGQALETCFCAPIVRVQIEGGFGLIGLDEFVRASAERPTLAQIEVIERCGIFAIKNVLGHNVEGTNNFGSEVVQLEERIRLGQRELDRQIVHFVGAFDSLDPASAEIFGMSHQNLGGEQNVIGGIRNAIVPGNALA